MSPDKGLKHKPFSSLRNAARAAHIPAPKPAPTAALGTPLNRIIVREELDSTSGAVMTRIIGLPHEHRTPLGKRLRDGLGHAVLIEDRDLLVMTADCERIATLLRDAGASEVKIVRREAPVDLSHAGEPGGTLRSHVRRGLRVAIVQKADQETGALTEGVVRDILTSSPEHPRGIKVRLESGEVGRVRRILSR